MCEAFVRIKPHFGLWLKIFNVKPKIVVGQKAECGGAMVGKMPNITLLEGSYVKTLKGWQSGWFYITEPRDATWVAAPEFRSGIPMQLTSWKKKVLPWGVPAELTGLQNCVKNMITKKIKLVNVVQVMLFRRILPCQDGHSTCGSSINTRHYKSSLTRRTKTSGRCCSRPPRYLLPLPRIRLSAMRPANPVSSL